MPYRSSLLGACCVLALTGCASNQDIAAQRCSFIAGQAYDQCVALELATIAKAQAAQSSVNNGGY